jgi:hypothetical protein
MTRKTGLVLASLVALTLVVAGSLSYAGDSCGSSCSSKKAKNASTTAAQTKAGSTCSSTCSATNASAAKSDPACAAVCGTTNASASPTAQPQAVTAGSSCGSTCASKSAATTAGGACCASKGASATTTSAGCSMKCDASKTKAGCTGMTMNKGVFDANVYKVENGTKYAVADGKKFVVTESTPSMTVGNARFYFADASCAVSCSEMMKASAPKYTHEAASMASVERNVKVEGDKKMATCEMSGNTFEITASTPSICKDGEKVYFCGEGCCNSYMGI